MIHTFVFDFVANSFNLFRILGLSTSLFGRRRWFNMFSDLFLRSTLSVRLRRVLSFLSFHLLKLVIDVIV